MSKKRGKRGVFFLLSCTLFLGLIPGARRADSTTAAGDAYVEVHGPDIAYVPLSAKYVKYDGVVRKVSRFAAALNAVEEDCGCPNCCDGRCYVIIRTDMLFPGGVKRILFILWLKC